MTRFLNGPLAGRVLSLRRAPIFLRVTIAWPGGAVDALNLIEDEPRPDETIHIYRRVAGTGGVVFIRPGGHFEYGDYVFVPEVDGDSVRESAAWRERVERLAEEAVASDGTAEYPAERAHDLYEGQAAVDMDLP